MDNPLLQGYTDYLNNTVLRPLANIVKSQSDEISRVDVDGLVQMFQNVLQLPKSGSSSVSFPSQPSMNNSNHFNQPLQQLPTNIGSSQFSPPMVNMSGFGSGLGAPVPPKPTASRGRAKAPKVESPWYSIEQFTALHQQGHRLCAYCAPRSVHKDQVCGAPATNADTVADFRKWRCDADLTKVGVIEKKLNNQIQGVVPPSYPGFNAPMTRPAPVGAQTRSKASSSTTQSNFPNLPAFPSLPGDIQGLPGLPMLNGIANNMSSLPGLPMLSNGIQNDRSAMYQQQATQQYEPPTELDVGTAEGLKPNHYLTSHPKAPKWLVHDGEKMVILGKFGYNVDDDHKFEPDYEKDLIPLTSEEQKFAIHVLGIPYENENHRSQGQMPSVQSSGPLNPIQTLGGLPGLPGMSGGLPGLPGLPGMSGGLPGLPGLPGIPAMSTLDTVHGSTDLPSLS
jgi:hypothetical protein